MTRKEVKDELYTQLRKQQHVTIKLTERDKKKARDFADKVAEAKVVEGIYKRDNKGISERHYVGKIGEIAIEKLLMTSYVDYSIGNSHKYGIPDLRDAGYEIGVKTTKKQNGVIFVPARPKYPQIVCVFDEVNSLVHIMGLITVETMKQYGDEELLPPFISPSYKKGFGKYTEITPLTRELIDKYKSR